VEEATVGISYAALERKIESGRRDFRAVKDRRPDVYYSIAQNRLRGRIGQTSIDLIAYSGGGEGATTASNVSRNPLAHLPTTGASYASKAAIDADNRGGPLPPGWWYVEPPGSYESAQFAKPIALLVPIGNQLKQFPGRDFNKAPFLVHGRGQLGSDGCLVMDKTDRVAFLDAVESNGGAYLYVTWEGFKGIMNDGVVAARIGQTA